MNYIDHESGSAIYPLSSAQRDIWLDEEINSESLAYTIGGHLRIEGVVEAARLSKAFDKIVMRHDALRIRILPPTSEHSLPRQEISSSTNIPMSMLDFTQASNPESEAIEWVNKKLRTKIFWFDWPLLDVTLLKIKSDLFYLVLRIHHLISDGWSMGVIARDLCNEYNNRPHSAVASSFLNFTAQEDNFAKTSEFLKNQEYWINKYATPPEAFFGVASNSDKTRSGYDSLSFVMEESIFSQVENFSQNHKHSKYNIILAAFYVYLSITNKKSDIVLGIPVVDRWGSEKSSAIGLFLNLIPSRFNISPEASFLYVISCVKEILREDYKFRKFSADQFYKKIHLPGSRLRKIYDVIFSYEHRGEGLNFDGASAQFIRFPNLIAETPLAISAVEEMAGADRVKINIAFDLKYFEAIQIRDLFRGVSRILEAGLRNPEIPVDRLPLLNEAERKQVLVRFNATDTEYPREALIHQLFEAQVQATPHAVALVYEDTSLTYVELNARANRLAHRLHALGVQPDQRVAICVERGFEMVVGLLGILKAGGAYVPLDPDYPAGRLAFMLEDSSPVALLTQSALLPALPRVTAPVILLDTPVLDTEPEHNLEPAGLGLNPHHLAYVIYTSGSTGTPKGVMNEHGGVVNRLHWARSEYTVGPQDRVLQKTSLSFDVSVWEVFLPLLSGAQLVLARPHGHKDSQYLAGLIQARGISIAHFVPSMLQLFLAQVRVGRDFPLRCLLASGEALSSTLQLRTAEVLPGVELHNLYGPTEAAVDVTAWHCRPGIYAGIVPIGRPVANTQIYILDAHGNPVPIGVAGEIHIGGVQVARGYLYRPELTAARFVRDPFSSHSGARLYRTGDLGRWLPDGNIEFLGRNDFQVKIRGFRIELGEIEARLAALPQVRDAAVIAREDTPGNQRLVAYLIPHVPAVLDIATVREQLASVLPEYMVPGAFVGLAAFPLTPNGKLDRHALPAPDDSAVISHVYAAPVGPLESTIAGIWQDLLGLQRVGRHDNFFELGGHSLLAVTLIERLRQQDINTDVRSVFTTSSVATLASLIGRNRPAPVFLVPDNLIPRGSTAITPAMLPLVQLSQEQIDRIVEQVPQGASNIQDIYPLGPLQQGILFHHLLESEGDAYIMRSVLAFDSRARLDRFVDALQEVIDRHDILRSAAYWNELPEPVQVVHRHAPLPVEELDLSAASDVLEALRKHTDPRHLRLDLRRAPLLAAYAVCDPHSGEWLLALLNHHLVCDHLTVELLVSEVQAVLQERRQQLPTPLPYRNFIAQAGAIARGEHEAYFREQLGDIEEPTIPFGFLNTRGDGSELDEARSLLDPELAQRIRENARQLGVTPAVLFHVAWAQVLGCCTGRDDVVFGTVLSGRLQGSAGADRVLGMFINTLPVRISLGNVTARQAILDTHTRLGELLVHEQASLTLAQRCSAVPPSMPLFTALLNYRHSAPGMTEAAGTLAWEGIRILGSEERSNYPLALSVDDLGADFSLTAQCVRGIVATRITAYLVQALEGLLQALVAGSSEPVGHITVLPEAEREQVLVQFNATEAAYPHEALIHQLFEAQVQATPHAVALVYEDTSLTYAELNARANRLAHRLHALGVQPDQRVAICVERSFEMVVGLLGILKAGGAYVPLDPDYPAGRLAFMLEDSSPVALLTQSALLPTLPRVTAPVILLDAPVLDTEPEHNLEPAGFGLNPHHLAYVIYTSGSTGTPKGVMVEHAGVINLVTAQTNVFNVQQDSRVLQFSSFSFDASLSEIAMALCSGAALCLASRNELMPGVPLRDTLRRYAITHITLPPSVLRLLSKESAAPGITYIAAGEALRLDSLASFEKDRASIFNAYGPTESTVCAAIYPHPSVQTGIVPIGRPIANTQIYILDAHGNPVPIGVAGELYIGGAGVARGYLNRPELTATRFVRDPFSSHSGARLYRTGDLGRWLPDGNIEFLGRNDFQVKIRGFRIELGEIEARLAALPQVRDAAVIAREDTPGNQRLVAYLIPQEPAILDIAAVREQLASVLPEYMVPGAFVSLAAFPLTPNGKLDRHALPAPDDSAVISHEYAAPVGPLESTIAGIWQDLLGLQRVGRHDNFFELGGHSLLAVTLIERLRQVGFQTNVRVLFGKPTVAALAGTVSEPVEVVVPPNLIAAGCTAIEPQMLPLISLTQKQIDGIVAGVPGGAANVQDIYPLAPLQEGILYHHLSTAQGDPYVLHAVFSMQSRTHLDGFAAALQAVIARHDILRTSVAWDGLDAPVQVVWREAPLGLDEIVLNPREGDTAQQLQARFDTAHTKLEIREAPLIRLAYAHDEVRDRWVALLMAHHIVLDHVAMAVLQKEVQMWLTGEAAHLPPAIPYRTYVAQAKLGVSEASHEAFFRDMLQDVDEPTLPFGLTNVQGDGSGIAEAKLPLGSTLAQRMRTQARALGVSAASLCHLAWGRVLAAVSGRDTVVFGTVLLGRMQGGAGADRAPGLFINTLPLRVSVGTQDVQAAVKETGVRLAALLEHEHASLALAQRCSGVAAPVPLFSALLNYRHSDRAAAHAGQDLWPGIAMLEAYERTNYPLVLSVDDFGEEFELTVQAVSGIDARRVGGYMRTALESLLDALETAPHTAVHALTVLPADERLLVLETFNTAEAAWHQDHTVHQLFEAQVARTPAAVAVTFDGISLTYGELNAQANQVAHRLREFGISPDDRVALCAERGIEMMVGILAILKAGGAYVPLDPAYPRERLAYVLTDSAPVAVLAQAGVREVLGDIPVPLIELDPSTFAAGPDHNPVVPGLSPHHLAYIIYTSGSTGEPKGVMIEHRNVPRLFAATVQQFGFGEHDVWTLFHSFAFDFSVWEMWGALLHGGRLVVVPKQVSRSPHDFYRLLHEEGVTILNQTPGAFRQLIAAQGESDRPHRLRQVIFGGEALEPAMLQPWYARRQNANTQLVNMYGITETTVHVTYRALNVEDARHAGRSPIGKQLSDLRLYVLDERGEPVPVGVAGEIYVGGAGVARGYLNRAGLTAERFMQDPFSAPPSARMYRTGDLGRWLADGSIEYLGRNDDQVKIRGFRIELGEIDAQLSQIAGVKEAAVLVREDASGDKQLVGYVVSHEGVTLAPTELRERLSAVLADYMVPSAFVSLDVLPLTPNGKLDRRALPAPDKSSMTTQTYEVPHGETETAIARIWQELLGVDQVGRHDNFFDLGGHSLKVMVLLTRLGSVFDRKISQIDFYRQLTVAGLATLLACDEDRTNGLVPVIARGAAQTRLTVVCVPYAGGSATVFKPLADALCLRDPTLAVRALALPGNELGTAPQDYVSVEQMAQACADELLASDPGEIAVYGHCVGSFLALELVHELEQRGQKVAFFAAAAAFPLPRLLRTLPAPAPWRFTSDRKLHALTKRWGGVAGEVDPEIIAFMMGNFRRDTRLAFEYERRRTHWKIAAPILCIVSQDDPLTRRYARRFRGWSSLSDKVALAVLPEGQHYFVGTQPDRVADEIFKSIKEGAW
ncbi:non-ribosomal peptide synthetase [Paraburkholderia megapolitana]|nr:non-ribosomal peptide synthetase [Paraburkholderia megapolitana]